MSVIMSRVVMTTTVLLSAFLLFQIQPLITKFILPWYGGVATVWTICILFFQSALLLGYAYSHYVVAYLKPKSQGYLHAMLLLLSLLLLPISPDKSLAVEYGTSPIVSILSLLTLSIGVPYFFLSSTSSLIQSWYSRLNPNLSPYPLYALSNIGSITALLSYPILIETSFIAEDQAAYWSVGYAVFVGLLVFISLYIASHLGSLKVEENIETADNATDSDSPVIWFFLAASASIMLLATTDHLSRDVASVPFLWVIPLALYLLSFILCFESDRWYRRGLFISLFIVFLAGLVADNLSLIDFSFIAQINLYCGLLFVVCMLCHGELAGKRPPASRLTKFYLIVAIGGAVGGLYVGLLAPKLFLLPLELFIGLGMVIITIAAVIYKDRQSKFYLGNSPWFWRSYSVFFALFLAFFYFQSLISSYAVVEFKRNFYGTLRVMEKQFDGGPKVMSLVHGTTEHGIEILSDEDSALTPTAYYSYESGIGQLLTSRSDRALNVGMIGLGIGTVATYFKEGDNFKIYEINPQVTEMAYKHFRYLDNTKADVEIVHGDGRLLLETEKALGFDILTVDAFSGDSIPVHLLTSQAFELYSKHLKSDGILAIHTSNQYLDLRPVIHGVAKNSGYNVVEISNGVDASKAVHKSQWFLLTKDDKALARLQSFKLQVPKSKDLQTIIWTDNFSNIFSILK